jgi:hypothetical protein
MGFHPGDGVAIIGAIHGQPSTQADPCSLLNPMGFHERWGQVRRDLATSMHLAIHQGEWPGFRSGA